MTQQVQHHPMFLPLWVVSYPSPAQPWPQPLPLPPFLQGSRKGVSGSLADVP